MFSLLSLFASHRWIPVYKNAHKHTFAHKDMGIIDLQQNLPALGLSSFRENVTDRSFFCIYQQSQSSGNRLQSMVHQQISSACIAGLITSCVIVGFAMNYWILILASKYFIWHEPFSLPYMSFGQRKELKLKVKMQCFKLMQSRIKVKAGLNISLLKKISICYIFIKTKDTAFLCVRFFCFDGI